MISYQLNKKDAKKSRGTKVQLLIDKMMLCDCRKRHKSLGMAWIDYKKAHDMVPHSWILESLEIVQVSCASVWHHSRICKKISGKLTDKTDRKKRKFGES